MQDLQTAERNTTAAIRTPVVDCHPAAPTENTGRVPVLDGIRSIAILAVMLFHFFQHGPTLSGSLLPWLGTIAVLRQTGVDLFFVLSGFLITGILLKQRGRPGALSRFYLRRSARIFPLYYAYLTAAFILPPLFHLAPQIPWADQWWFWVFAQDLQDTFIPRFVFFGPGHFWSLAVEEHFYLVWPLLVLRLPEHRLKQVLFGIIGLALITRGLLVELNYPVFYFTLCRMDAIATGALIALLRRNPPALQHVGAKVRRWGVLGAVASTGVFHSFTGTGHPLVQVLKYLLIAVLWGAVLVLALTAKPYSWPSRILSCRPASVVAKGSYSLFVFHPIIFEACKPMFSLVPFSVSLLLAFSATGVAAFVSWHLIEYPFLRWTTSQASNGKAKPARPVWQSERITAVQS